MQNQHPNKDTYQREYIRSRHSRWRHIILIFALLVMICILSPLILLRDEAQNPVARLYPGASQQHSGHAEQIGQKQEKQKIVLELAANRVNKLLTSLVGNQQFSGSVLIARQGKILLEQGYGEANWTNSIANTVNTRFYLASLTKEFTAMAILILQERGKLRVGNKVCNYIPNCPEPWQPLTIHQILTHTSGIPELDTSQLSEASPEAWIASFSSAPLQFAPGSLFNYCSTCYQILAYVVQRVSGIPYSQFIQRNILGPLQMKSSGFDTNFYYSQRAAAEGYQSWQISAPQLGWQLDPKWSFLSGSGLLYSTVGDLYRWDQALYTNTLVSQQTLAEAFTPYVNSTLFAGSAYGYGWFITQSPANHRLIWHNGAIDGFRNYIGRYVNDNVTIIILSNLATLDTISLAHSMEQIIFQ